jgi:TnpA family transposase
MGLNPLIAAIILWNTTYLRRAVDRLRNQGMIRHPVIRPSYRHSAGSTSI